MIAGSTADGVRATALREMAELLLSLSIPSSPAAAPELPSLLCGVSVVPPEQLRSAAAPDPSGILTDAASVRSWLSGIFGALPAEESLVEGSVHIPEALLPPAAVVSATGGPSTFDRSGSCGVGRKRKASPAEPAGRPRPTEEVFGRSAGGRGAVAGGGKLRGPRARRSSGDCGAGRARGASGTWAERRVPLSQSLLWRQQQGFYETMGVSAFTKQVTALFVGWPVGQSVGGSGGRSVGRAV
jgi:hypothetical protein